MKRPTILYNVGIAVIMTVIALFAGFVMQYLFYGTQVTGLTLSLLTIIYIGQLLVKSDIRFGKITLGLTCLAIFIILLLIKVNLSSLLLISVGLIWITRSLLYYSSLLPVIADLTLSVISLASALWGFFISGSLVISIWCFFLTQALSSLIPKRFIRQSQTETNPEKDRFNQAYQSAEIAIRALVQKS